LHQKLNHQLSEPIFDGGRIRNNYHLSQAQEQEMLLAYRKTILNALKDVSNSLVAYKETRERCEEQTALVVSATDAVRLAKLRYSGGNASYLEVLTTDTDLYDAQLKLAQTQVQEASSLVQPYAALGAVGSDIESLHNLICPIIPDALQIPGHCR
jgi:multidrug efflux system outer membrane protein